LDGLSADAEVETLRQAKLQERERLAALLQHAKPLRAQVKVAEKSRDDARRLASALADEVSVLSDLLAVKQAAAGDAEAVAVRAQQEYLALAAKHAEEEGITSAPPAPATVAPELLEAIAALQAQLPGPAAQSLANWMSVNVAPPSPSLSATISFDGGASGHKRPADDLFGLSFDVDDDEPELMEVLPAVPAQSSPPEPMDAAATAQALQAAGLVLSPGSQPTSQGKGCGPFRVAPGRNRPGPFSGQETVDS